jgi:hypothetical protein
VPLAGRAGRRTRPDRARIRDDGGTAEPGVFR